MVESIQSSQTACSLQIPPTLEQVPATSDCSTLSRVGVSTIGLRREETFDGVISAEAIAALRKRVVETLRAKRSSVLV